MYNFFADLLIWTFAIFGFIKFLDEFLIDIICYIINFFIYIPIILKKFVAKLSG